MLKKAFNWHNKKYYLIGRKDGEDLYLEAASFNCGWYWGIGYVETFTNRKRPERSADISCHTHFNTLFPTWKAFVDNLDDTPFTERERWQIYEIMECLYTARNYSDMIHRGSAHYTNNDAADIIKDDAEYKRINETVIPALLKNLYGIMEQKEAH